MFIIKDVYCFPRINFTDGTSCIGRINAWLDSELTNNGNNRDCCPKRSATCDPPESKNIDLSLYISWFYHASYDILNLDLEGPSDFGGQCPSGSYEWRSSEEKAYCCCAGTCCMNNCRLSSPPEDCLSNIPGGARWVWNEERGWYRAIRGSAG